MRLQFRELPALAQGGIAVSYLSAWVLIAEFVIDRYGLSRYLPFYRTANVCVWDGAVLAGILVMLFALNRRQPPAFDA